MAKKENRHAELVSASANIEAPYELPEGWKWCRLGDVCKTFADGDWIESKDQSVSGIRLVQTGNIGNGEFRDKEDKYHYISEETFKKLKCTEIFSGDILISRLPEPVGRSCIIPNSNYKMITAVDCTIVRLLEDITCKNWFCYYTQSHVYAGLIHERCTGTTRLRISRKNLGEIPFPLPPTLAEQQRIVNRIETMFAKLDQAQEKAQAVLDSFETRKAAILHKAFTGQLTANWRKANGVPDDSWEEKSLEKIADVGSSKRVFTTEFTESGIPFYRGTEIGALAEKKSIKNELFISEMHYEELIKCSGKPEIGDLLLPSICPDGRIWNVDRNEPFYFKDGRVLWIHFQNKDNDSLYIKSYLINEFTQNYLKYASGSTFAELKIFALKSIIIKLPSLPEQQEIVRILDTVLEKESRAKEAVQTVLDQIALLKKSILARAFRGEL